MHSYHAKYQDRALKKDPVFIAPCGPCGISIQLLHGEIEVEQEGLPGSRAYTHTRSHHPHTQRTARTPQAHAARPPAAHPTHASRMPRARIYVAHARTHRSHVRSALHARRSTRMHAHKHHTHARMQRTVRTPHARTTRMPHARTCALRAHACMHARSHGTLASHARTHTCTQPTHERTHSRTHARTHVCTHVKHHMYAACVREGGGAGAARQRRCGQACGVGSYGVRPSCAARVRRSV